MLTIRTTGITAKVVERMEEALKRDVLEEIRAGDGRLLLHDEVETKPGTYEIIPIWEAVDASDVMTPKELYQTVTSEAYNVDYQRVAVTDEQAPLPATLQAIVMRVATGLERGSDFVFNCQMGRGRTTTGMIVASLIATVQLDDMMAESTGNLLDDDDESSNGDYSTDASQYLNGTCCSPDQSDTDVVRRIQDHPPARHGPEPRQAYVPLCTSHRQKV